MILDNFKIDKEVRNQDGIISLVLAPILVIALFLVGLLFQYLSFSTPSEIKELKGRGKLQIYDAPYDEVFHSAIELINDRGLTIVESSKENAYLIATEGSEFLNEGRVIALFFTSESSQNGVRVEVVSKFMALPPLKELILSRNGASQILNDLGKNLETANGNN